MEETERERLFLFCVYWYPYWLAGFAVTIQTKLRNAREDTAGALRSIETGLARRQEAATTKAVLELMLDTANVVAKVRA